MGTRYTTTPAIGFGSSPPPDDGTQVAANLITWAGVKTKLADPVHVQADAIDTKLVSALDLSARAIASNDTAIASDHWKTLQVTGTTTIQLSSAASMGAGYEVGVFNAGTGVVTVAPAGSDTINALSASVTVSIKGTKIFRTNQALTGYNIVGQTDPQALTVSAANLDLNAFTITSTTGTNAAAGSFNNAGGTLFVGIDSSTSSRVTGSGNAHDAVFWYTGNHAIAFGINNALALKIPAIGQLQFPATQNPSADANTLDDYEEGTWTPSLGGNTTYTVQSGTYTKVGRQVTITSTVQPNVQGTGSTTVISGLPFAAGQAVSLAVTGTALATAIVSLCAQVAAAGSQIVLTSRTGASASDGSSAIFQSGAVVIVSGTYQI